MKRILIAPSRYVQGPGVLEEAGNYVCLFGSRILAIGGEKALTLFKQEADEIGCVLLDLTMPRRDGVSTFRELKIIRPDIPVILCTGYREPDALRQFGDADLAGFLHKPYGLKELKAVLDTVLKAPP